MKKLLLFALILILNFESGYGQVGGVVTAPNLEAMTLKRFLDQKLEWAETKMATAQNFQQFIRIAQRGDSIFNTTKSQLNWAMGRYKEAQDVYSFATGLAEGGSLKEILNCLVNYRLFTLGPFQKGNFCSSLNRIKRTIKTAVNGAIVIYNNNRAVDAARDAMYEEGEKHAIEILQKRATDYYSVSAGLKSEEIKTRIMDYKTQLKQLIEDYLDKEKTAEYNQKCDQLRSAITSEELNLQEIEKQRNEGFNMLGLSSVIGGLSNISSPETLRSIREQQQKDDEARKAAYDKVIANNNKNLMTGKFNSASANIYQTLGDIFAGLFFLYGLFNVFKNLAQNEGQGIVSLINYGIGLTLYIVFRTMASYYFGPAF